MKLCVSKCVCLFVCSVKFTSLHATVVPCSRLKFGERAFSIAATRAWNSIPADLRVTLNTATFKKNLQTFLFRESYSTFWLNSFVTFALLHCPFYFWCIVFFVIWLVGLCCKPQPLVIIIIIITPTYNTFRISMISRVHGYLIRSH